MNSKGIANLRGIDISNWQGNIDFGAVKNSGIQVVYMKASEGNYYRDKFLDQNYNNAKANGLYVGFYHFFRANIDAVAQAQYFVNCIQGKESDCKLCIDIETTEGCDANILSVMCGQFLEEVKRLVGKEVVLYTYTSFARCNLTNVVGCYPLWIADYRGENRLPNDNPIWNEWSGYQFCSDGRVNGINTDCDMNLFTEDILIIPQPSVKYAMHVENQGWQDYVQDDEVSGTTGQKLRGESLVILLENAPNVDIEAYGHVQNIGWQNVRHTGEVIGTVGKELRLEAVKIKLTNAPKDYHIEYSAHVEGTGWQNWVRDGAVAGTTGSGKRLEAIKIKIVKA